MERRLLSFTGQHRAQPSQRDSQDHGGTHRLDHADGKLECPSPEDFGGGLKEIHFAAVWRSTREV